MKKSQIKKCTTESLYSRLEVIKNMLQTKSFSSDMVQNVRTLAEVKLISKELKKRGILNAK